MMTKPVYDSEISRRTLAKGAAWSVPAIAIAAASPAVAASPDAYPQGVQFTRSAQSCGANVAWVGKAGYTYDIEYQVHGSTTWHSAVTTPALTVPNGSYFISASAPVVKVRVRLSSPQGPWSESASKSVVPTVTKAILQTVLPGSRWKYDVAWTKVEGATSYTVEGYRINRLLGDTWQTIESKISGSTSTWSGKKGTYYERVRVSAIVCGNSYTSAEKYFQYPSGDTGQSVQPDSQPVSEGVGKESATDSSTSGGQTVSNGKDVATEKPSSNKKPASKQEAPVVESTTKPEPTPTVAEVVEAAVETE